MASVTGVLVFVSRLADDNLTVESGGSGTGNDVVVTWPTAPSWWWVAGLAVVSALVVAVLRRTVADRLVTITAACAGAGLVTAAALVLPWIRLGADLARQAPEIEGFELVDADLVLWPGRTDYNLATLRYRADRLLVDRFPPDLESVAADIGFTDGFPGRSNQLRSPRCQRIPPVNDSHPWEGDFYCLDGVSSVGLVVTAVRYTDSGLLWPRLVAYPLWWLAALLIGNRILGGPAVDDDRYRHPSASRFFFAFSLFLASGALYLTGLPVYDLARVDPVISQTGCDSAVDDRCRAAITEAIRGTDVADPAVRIYAFLYLLGYGAAAFLGSLAWVTALVTEPSGRRIALMAALTAIGVGLIVAAPLLYGNTLHIMSLYNE